MASTRCRATLYVPHVEIRPNAPEGFEPDPTISLLTGCHRLIYDWYTIGYHVV